MHDSLKVFQACVARHHFYQVDTYQPASRYWSLQATEFAVYLGLAAILAIFTVWWTLRRKA
jgi:hypothetical protein